MHIPYSDSSMIIRCSAQMIRLCTRQRICYTVSGEGGGVGKWKWKVLVAICIWFLQPTYILFSLSYHSHHPVLKLLTSLLPLITDYWPRIQGFCSVLSSNGWYGLKLYFKLNIVAVSTLTKRNVNNPGQMYYLYRYFLCGMKHGLDLGQMEIYFMI